MAQFWNERYGKDPEFVYGKEPNAFLKETISAHPNLIPAGGKILSLGEGEGRNAVYLAMQGFRVHCVDYSQAGLDKILQLAKEMKVPEGSITAELQDLQEYDWDSTEEWDAILNIWLHVPSQLRKRIHSSLSRKLKSGSGFYLLEWYTADNIGRGTGGPQNPDQTVDKQALLSEIDSTIFEIVKCEHFDRHISEGLELRQMWQFAAVVQFLTTFGQELMPQYDHPSSTETIEDALLSKTPNYFLKNLHVHLLRLVTGTKFINEETCWQWYKRVFEERLPQEELTKFEDFFAELTHKQKTIGLNHLCELLLDDADWFRQKMKDPEEQEYWRVDPVGYDAQMNTYWLFDDNRLYAEKCNPEEQDKPSDTSSKSPDSNSRKNRRSTDESAAALNANIQYEHKWQPVCLTIEDWQTFPLKFEKSKNRYEKALFKALTNDIVPTVLTDLKQKRKELELQEALYNRKRSTRLVGRELEIMELERQEELRRADQEAIAASRRAGFSSRRDESQRQRDEEEKIARLKDREERAKKREEAIAKQRQEEELKKAKEESLKAIKDKMNTKKEGKESWTFKCYCGVKGKNLDDGKPMLSCERCETWFHIACVDDRLKKKRVPAKNWQVDEYICERCINSDKRVETQKRVQEIRKIQTEAEVDVVGDGDDAQHKAKIPKVKLTLSQHQPQPNGFAFAPQPFMSPQQVMSSSPMQQGQFYIQPPMPWFYLPQQAQQQIPQMAPAAQGPSPVVPMFHIPGRPLMHIPTTHSMSGQYIMPMIAAQQQPQHIFPQPMMQMQTPSIAKATNNSVLLSGIHNPSESSIKNESSKSTEPIGDSVTSVDDANVSSSNDLPASTFQVSQ